MIKFLYCRYLYKLFTELSKHKGKLAVRHLPVEDIAPVLPQQIEVSVCIWVCEREREIYRCSNVKASSQEDIAPVLSY